MSTNFSAGPQALGYIYQIRYALFLLINAQNEAVISIEKLDDVTLEDNSSTASNLIQLKRHSDPNHSIKANSVDLWKTLRVWSDNLLKNRIDISSTILTLVTTSKVDDTSILALLKPKNKKPSDLTVIIAKFDSIATAKKNKSLEEAFNAFLSLTQRQKEQLVAAIQVLDESVDVDGIPARIKRPWLEVAVPDPKFLDPFYERIEGWWYDRVIKHLLRDDPTVIKRSELMSLMRDIGQSFKPDSLPIDYLFEDPPDTPDANTDIRLFVKQLKEIALENKAIENAIRDYYRAFAQRTRWVQDGFLQADDLEKYEKRLVEEWEHSSAARKRKIKNLTDEEELKECGREIFQWMDENPVGRIPAIKRDVTEPYVIRGSYHILANQEPLPPVSWHPKFVERLQELLTSLEK